MTNERLIGGCWSLVIGHWSFSPLVLGQGRTWIHVRRLSNDRQLDQGPLGHLPLRSLELLAKDRTLVLDLVLQIDDRLDQLLGPRWATRDIHVDRNEAVDPLHHAIGVEH